MEARPEAAIGVFVRPFTRGESQIRFTAFSPDFLLRITITARE